MAGAYNMTGRSKIAIKPTSRAGGKSVDAHLGGRGWAVVTMPTAIE